MFIGGYDIFYADLPRMRSAAEAGGVELIVHELAKMPHVYPILPIPEGRPARATIVELVRG